MREILSYTFILFFIFFTKNILGEKEYEIERTFSIEKVLEEDEIDIEIFNFFKKNSIFSCEVKISKKDKKILIKTDDGSSYIGYVNKNGKPVGLWKKGNGVKECYFKNTILREDGNDIVYWNDSDFFFAIRSDNNYGFSRLYAKKRINGIVYSRNYIHNGELSRMKMEHVWLEDPQLISDILLYRDNITIKFID